MRTYPEMSFVISENAFDIKCIIFGVLVLSTKNPTEYLVDKYPQANTFP